jgi:signal transduction histidine kinase
MQAAAARPDGDVPNPEDLLQEYKELRERFQRTTNALASAAHDLKTPLSILNGYVDLLHSEKLGPLSDRQREVLNDMQASGKRLQQFIQDFLTYSALETGGLRMQFEPGQRQTPSFPLRLSQAGAGDFEPAGKFLQVHFAERNRLDARGAAHVGTPRHRPAFSR